MTINQLITTGNLKLPKKNPYQRIYYLTRAENRAKNPEWKELWRRKKEELIKNL